MLSLMYSLNLYYYVGSYILFPLTFNLLIKVLNDINQFTSVCVLLSMFLINGSIVNNYRRTFSFKLLKTNSALLNLLGEVIAKNV